MLLPGEVLSIINRAISPGLFALPVLEVVTPLTLVLGTVDVDVLAVAVGLVVDPVAFVDVAVNMHELAMPVSPIVAPLPLIASAIWPDLDTETVPEPADPLPCVGRTRLESIGRPLLALGRRIIPLLRHCLFGLVHSEVLAVGLIITSSIIEAVLPFLSA